MALPPDHLRMILDLECRHDQLLELLADLENRVAKVLAECQSGRPAAPTESPAQAPAEASRPVRTAA